MTYGEAVQAVKSERSVRRDSWPEGQVLKPSGLGDGSAVLVGGKVGGKGKKAVSEGDAHVYEWTDEDKAATDWVAL